MVRFGAEMVFSSKDSTITDEDIDRIIAKGEEATAELDAKMKKFTEDAIKFKMDDSTFTNGLKILSSLSYLILSLIVLSFGIWYIDIVQITLLLFSAAAELYDFDDEKVEILSSTLYTDISFFFLVWLYISLSIFFICF